MKTALAMMIALQLAAPAGNGGQGDAQLVVLGLRGIGVASTDVKKTERMLIEAARTHSGMRLMAPRSVSARLRQRGVLPGASWKELHAALGVKFALTGTLAAFGEELTLDLRLVNTADGSTVRQATSQVPQDVSKLKAVLEELVVRLCRPRDWTGSLELVVAEPGATVFLDGKEVARTPLEKPITGLSPGKHILRIVKEGFDEFSRFVEVRYGQRVRLEVDLKNNMLVGVLYEKSGKRPRQPQSQATAPGVRERVVLRGRKFMEIVAISAGSGGAAIGGAGAALYFAAGQRALGTAMMAAGGGLLVGAAVLWLVLPPRQDDESSVGFWITPAAGGSVVGIGFSF